LLILRLIVCVTRQTAHTEFTEANEDNQSGVTRDQKLRELAAAYDSFTELCGNLEEGRKVSTRSLVG